MSTTAIVIIVAVAAIIALVVIARDSGPRVTHITRTREHDDPDGDRD